MRSRRPGSASSAAIRAARRTCVAGSPSPSAGSASTCSAPDEPARDVRRHVAPGADRDAGRRARARSGGRRRSSPSRSGSRCSSSSTPHAARAARLRPARRVRDPVRPDRTARRPDARGHAPAGEPRPPTRPRGGARAGRRPRGPAPGGRRVRRGGARRGHRGAARDPRPRRRVPGRRRRETAGRSPGRRSRAPRPWRRGAGFRMPPLRPSRCSSTARPDCSFGSRPGHSSRRSPSSTSASWRSTSSRTRPSFEGSAATDSAGVLTRSRRVVIVVNGGARPPLSGFEEIP